MLLQRQAGKRWVTVATAHLDATCRYRMNALVTVPPGAVSVRVLAVPFGGAPAAASTTHVVTVADAPPSLLGPFSTVYLGLKAGSTPGSYTTLPGTPALDFTDDGRLTSAVPVAGPGSGAAALPPSVRTGVYAAHDGVVDVAWDTDGTTATLRPNSLGHLVWNGVTYGVVDPLNGGHLSGHVQAARPAAAEPRSRSPAPAVSRTTASPRTPGCRAPTTPPARAATASATTRSTLVYDSGPLETMAVYALPQFLGRQGSAGAGRHDLRPDQWKPRLT